jgi:Flp pilus assembly protein TadG
MKDPTQKSRRGEKGQSLVELAVGITVLLILVAGVVDLGRLLFFYISLRDATQEGVVVGQINPRTCAAIATRVNSYMNSSSYAPEVTVDGVDCPTAAANNQKACAGRDIKVRLNAPFHFAMPFMGGATINLASEATGTILQPACGT